MTIYVRKTIDIFANVAPDVSWNAKDNDLRGLVINDGKGRV